ncbi:404_t:CDS:2, partial [Dentiscutata heterogama]
KSIKKNYDQDDILIVDNVYDLEDEEAIEIVFERLIQNTYIVSNETNNINLSDDEITNDSQSDYENKTKIEKESLQWKQKLQEMEERIQYLINTSK